MHGFAHGEPKGASDPAFPEYTKDGWKVGDIIGAVIARVEPRNEPRVGRWHELSRMTRRTRIKKICAERNIRVLE